MAVRPTIDFTRLDADLRAVCAQHGLQPPGGEEVCGWLALIDVAGHFADGREYTRMYCVTMPGMDRCDVEHLLRQGQGMLTEEVSSLHPTG